MQTVGEILRSEREKRGLSIKDIELGTSIRSLYIKAIEENDFKVIPGEVYLKGFIRNYASYLGLDVQAIMDVYRQSQTPEAAVKSEKTTEVKASPKERTPQEDVRASEPSAKKDMNFGKIAGILILLVAAGGAFWWLNGSGQTPNPPPVKETKPAPTAPVLPSQPDPKTAVPPPVQQNKPVVVSAKFTANCWTLVTADGKEVYQGIPKAGETISWEAEKNIVVKVGNAGAVDLTYNGQSIGKLGGNGEVVEKTFTAKM